MFRAIQAIQLSVLSVALGTAAGCATISGGHAGARDVHATARIGGGGARVLVSGPVQLLHVDVDGHDELALYAVARKDGTDADCVAGAAQTGEKRRLRAGASNQVKMTVAAEETICVAPPASPRAASVMWHARRLDAGTAAGRGPALALEGQSR
jgi:hypothetical protein